MTNVVRVPYGDCHSHILTLCIAGTRKLKCSGDQPRCSRCERENIECVYSPQKQMGRPRKRRRDDDAAQGQESKPPTVTLRDLGSDPLVHLAPGIADTNFGPMEFPVAGLDAQQSAPVTMPYTNGQTNLNFDPFMLQDAMNGLNFPIDPALRSVLLLCNT